MEEKKYYNAYDKRYKIIHQKNSTWATMHPTPIILETLNHFKIEKEEKILEIGCGEGRDSIEVLKKGYSLTASDVSKEAINFCKYKYPSFKNNFKVIDICKNNIKRKYVFIYAVSVLHMLVEQLDRKKFFKFFKNHLDDNGIGLILTMGDGKTSSSTNPREAFTMKEKDNNASRINVLVPNTTCKIVSFDTLEKEIKEANLKIISKGITQSLPDFSSLMYVTVTK